MLWSTHGEDAWRARHDQIGVPKEDVESLLVTQTPLIPDVLQNDRLGRVNRTLRLPNGRRLRAGVETLAPRTETSPGAIEVGTLFVE